MPNPGRLERRLQVGRRLIAYTPALALGALFLVPTMGSFFSRGLCFCDDPPVVTGSFLLVVALATAWTWIQGLRGWAEGPTAAVRSLAYAGLAGATVTGALAMVQEISAILCPVPEHARCRTLLRPSCSVVRTGVLVRCLSVEPPSPIEAEANRRRWRGSKESRQ